MKAVSIILLLLIGSLIHAQDTLIFESNMINIEQTKILLEYSNFDIVASNNFKHNKLGLFSASFYKSDEEAYVLVEIDSLSDHQYVVLKNDSSYIKTNMNNFILPSGRYVIEIRFESCKYVKAGIDVRPCHTDLQFTLIPPSTPYDDDGMLIIHPPKDRSSWYYYHAPAHSIGSDTLYNVHVGYYNITGETSFGCKETIAIPVIYEGGNEQELETFDFDRVEVSKG